MKIVEQACVGKRGASLCEDRVVVSGLFVAVVDGSTSKSDYRLFSDRSNGRAAADIIAATLADEDFWLGRGEVACLTIAHFASALTRQLRTEYERRGVAALMAEHVECRLTASVAAYCVPRRELWMIGDCQALVDGQLHAHPKPIDEQCARQRAATLKECLTRGMTVEELLACDPGRQRILPSLIAECQGQNKAFSVVDGFEIPLDKVHVVALDRSAHDLVLATDGYPRLLPTLAESESVLADVLRADPLMMDAYPQTKGCYAGQVSYDDRAYVRLAVEAC